MHVGDLDGGPIDVNKKFWKASVSIEIHDAGEDPVANATVLATWSGGASGSASCTTDTTGHCTVVSGNIDKADFGSAMLTIDNVTRAAMSYAPAANHDPDDDSDGTVIVVSWP